MKPENLQEFPSVQLVRRQMARSNGGNPATAAAGPRLDGKAGLIFDEVERRLATGVYPFGSEIVTADLVREFGASRAPVTMAMNLLQAASYVTIRPQVGVWVVAPNDEEIADFFRLYARSEELHTHNATRRASEAALSILDLIDEQIGQAISGRSSGQDRELLMLSSLFHSQIRMMAGTPWLCQHSASAWRMSNFLTANRPGTGGADRHERERADRRRIIALMKAGDGKSAGAAMHEFIMSRCTVCADAPPQPA